MLEAQASQEDTAMRTKSNVAWLIVLLAMALAFRRAATPVSAVGFTPSSQLQSPASLPAVALRAASGATLSFKTQNGGVVDGIPPQRFDLPHLVLYRNGVLTQAEERTLSVEVNGIEVPASGVTVTLELETQHKDPDARRDTGQRISVWRESRWLAPPLDASPTGITALFALEFGATVVAGSESIATPTDYFRYEITVTDADHPMTDPLHTSSGEYAFLMENQWVARLPKVYEESPGAAPDKLIVYYADMFPFRQDVADPATWLPREKVTDYVGTELLPQMVEAFRVQSDEWGFPWTLAWTSYRSEDAKRLSVALGDGQTWFHGPAPFRGNAAISIKATGGDNAEYDTLADGILSAFHHELFHNLQRNLNLNMGGDGRAGGQENAWQFFSEGTATLASSVGQPGIQFAPSRRPRAYMHHANTFLQWGRGRFQDLIVDYERTDPYSAALYWRFLYEQCGGLRDGGAMKDRVEDPAAGMRVIQRALTVLYSGEVVDVDASMDLVGATPKVLDRALAGSSCPFQTYKESLTAFARTVYALRLDGGRCREPGTPTGCGFYDPHDQYREPYLATLIPFAGVAQMHRGKAMSGFGMAFVDVLLDPATDGQPLTVELSFPSADGTEFNLQILHLADSQRGDNPQHVMTRAVAVEVPPMDGHGNRRFMYDIPAIDRAAYNRLGLIITRLDAQETSEPRGEYTILLRPGPSPISEAVGDLAQDVRP
jgi:hypothetical protein